MPKAAYYAKQLRSDRFVNKEMLSCVQDMIESSMFWPTATSCPSGAADFLFDAALRTTAQQCSCSDSLSLEYFDTRHGNGPDLVAGEVGPIARRALCLGNSSSFTATCGVVDFDGKFEIGKPLWYNHTQ